MSVLNTSNPVDYASGLPKEIILKEINTLQNKLNTTTDNEEYRWTLFCLEVLNNQHKKLEGIFAIDQINILDYYHNLWKL